MTDTPKYTLRQPKISIDTYKDLPAISKLLILKGVTDSEAVDFLNPNFEAHVHDPFLLKDMQKTVNRVFEAIEKKEKILIYSDFDADGIPGAAIIHDFFTTISYPHVEYVAPNRHTMGFGFHPSLVKPYIDTGVRLIITIDCGIADVRESVEIQEYAQNQHGITVDIVITDHHLPSFVLPQVFAIINPKQSTCVYPEKMLCGAAVIYKLVVACVTTIRMSENQNISIFKEKICIGYEKWLLDLVGISTLSDMVPLIGENRTLAHFGLVVLRKSKRPGIRMLCHTNMIHVSKIVEEDVTFTMAPRINVASRLASSELAFNLLIASDFIIAENIAKELNSINAKRKILVSKTMAEVKNNLKMEDFAEKPILVVGSLDFKPPILGLVATQLIRTYKKPVFAWGKSDDGKIKGSVRSLPEIDIVELMSNVKDGLFINKGGHAQSGGFSMTIDNVYKLDESLQIAHKNLYGLQIDKKADVTELFVDLEIDISDVHLNFYNQIQKLAPFGVGNEKPIFAIRGADSLFVRKFGKQKEHLEIDCGPFKAIQFFSDYTDEALIHVQQIKNPIIIGHIELNQFKGACEIRIKLINIV